ncbi:MAG: YceI family protein [Pseudomonadota bacterium]
MNKTIIAAALFGLGTLPVAAEERWILNGAESKLAYGSIKKNVIGEVNHFAGLTGSVSETGSVDVTIDLFSVETWVDIRNERMREHVFGAAPKAHLSAEIDMDAVNAMAPGETAVVDVEGTLSFAGAEMDIYTEMFVARLGTDRALVTTDEMIMVSTAELGIDAGVDTLKKLAELPGITRVAPVTLRLVFERTGEGA